MSEDAEAKAEGGAESLTITVKSQDGEETIFKIKPSTKMSKIFNAYAQRKGIDPDVVRFLCDGARIKPVDTPGSLELEDGDMIQVVLAQNGGC